VLATVVAGPLLACDARSLTTQPDGGGGTGGSIVWPELVSDFEDLAGATVVGTGSPPRHGSWYTYNDASPTCVQTPAAGAHYVGEAPPVRPPTPSGAFGGFLTLHALWAGCSTWGAGIGADINTPVVPDGEIYTGPKVPYDLSRFGGIRFFARGEPNTDTHLRFKLPMRATTAIQNGGTCDDIVVGADRCGDDWGLQFDLPANGTWKEYVVRFSGVAFMQEGWGAAVPWNPSDVTGIQIQSANKGEPYDFWIDDMYLER
jgi:hypothetical protein